MGLDLGRIGRGIVTLGNSEIFGAARDRQNREQDSYSSNLYNQNQANWNQAMDFGKGLESQVMGESAKNVGKKATEYQNQLYADINKPTIEADVGRQKADLNLSRANAKAGLAGVDTTAGMQQEGRNAAMQAESINEKSKMAKNALYGQSLAATQNAAANLWLGTMGMAMGSQQTPQPLQKKGLLGQTLSDIGIG